MAAWRVSSVVAAVVLPGLMVGGCGSSRFGDGLFGAPPPPPRMAAAPPPAQLEPLPPAPPPSGPIESQPLPPPTTPGLGTPVAVAPPPPVGPVAGAAPPPDVVTPVDEDPDRPPPGPVVARPGQIIQAPGRLPPETPDGALPPPVSPAVGSGRSSYTGSWTARDGSGDACKVQLSATPTLDLYKASSSGCRNGELGKVNAWDYREGEVFLYSAGSVVARLKPEGRNAQGALSRSGAPVTLSR